MKGQNTPSQNTQTQNTQSQNTQAQSSHLPKRPKIHSHTNWIINSVLNCKFSKPLITWVYWCLKKSVPPKKVPQVKVFTEIDLEQKNSREKQKDGYTRGLPHKLFGTVNQTFDWIHMAFVTVKQDCDPLYIKMIFKIFGTLESFNFQNIELLQNWSWMSLQ